MKEESKLDRAKNVAKEFNKAQGKILIKSASDVGARRLLSFGVEGLDTLTNGGIQYGVTTVIYGEEAIGKTTLALKLITQAQKENKICLYADIERSFSGAWAKKQGVNLDTLIYGAFYYAEQPLDAIIKFAKNEAVDVIVIDSIQGLSPLREQIKKKVQEKSVADDSMGLLPAKLSQFFRMAIPYVSDAKIALIMIGQVRTGIGDFIPLDKLTGGHALKHNSRLTLRVRRGQKADAPVETIVDDDGMKHHIQFGFDMVVRVDKQQREGIRELDEVHLPFYFGQGFSVLEDEEIVSEETEQKVKQGLQEAKEGKLIPQEELEKEGLLDKPKKKRGRPKKEIK